MTDVIASFRAALADAGIHLAAGSQIIPDGQLHRARAADDKAGQRTAWYRLHLDAPVAGAGGDWRKGISTRWTAKRQTLMSAAERAELARRIERERKEAEAEQEARHREAAKRGKWAWEHATPASPSHEYLQRKGLAPGIARQRGDALVLPVLDFSGYLRGVQYIRPDGTKRFIAGMAKAGAYIPAATRPDGTRALWVAEGWGTACALQAMRPQVCCIAGLDAGNLASVALEARKRWPALDIVIAHDFDRVGRQKGLEAAIAARAKVLPPPATVPPGCTDWLDVRNAKRQGVRSC